ncbi:hypothetical protein M8J75_014571 [Diaphorina citri]|nr:hypothetical protein M8J75_014571 [Diaphorina citri]
MRNDNTASNLVHMWSENLSRGQMATMYVQLSIYVFVALNGANLKLEVDLEQDILGSLLKNVEVTDAFLEPWHFGSSCLISS